jgi:hypothetical protein
MECCMNKIELLSILDSLYSFVISNERPSVLHLRGTLELSPHAGLSDRMYPLTVEDGEVIVAVMVAVLLDVYRPPLCWLSFKVSRTCCGGSAPQRHASTSFVPVDRHSSLFTTLGTNKIVQNFCVHQHLLLCALLTACPGIGHEPLLNSSHLSPGYPLRWIFRRFSSPKAMTPLVSSWYVPALCTQTS